MGNGECHVGSANKANIEANEKRIVELSRMVSEMVEKFDYSHGSLLNRMDQMSDDFTGKFERLSDRFSKRPSWSMMFILTSLSSLCVGLIVYMIKG